MKDNINEISSNKRGLEAKKTSEKRYVNLTYIIGNAFFVLAWFWMVIIMAYLTMRLFFS